MIPIAKFPMVPLNVIIKSMEHIEIVKLALTSKKLECCVKLANIDLSLCEVRLRDELSNIAITEEYVLLCCGTREDDMVLTVKKDELKNWLNPNLSVIENTANVLKHLRDIFRFKYCELVLDMGNMKKTNVQNIFSIDEFRKHTHLSILAGKISARDLKHIMEVEKRETVIEISGVIIPALFRSKNAFKFNIINYEDARWVRVEDLYSLRNSTQVKLGKNILKTSDFNSLLKYWVNSEHDMFGELTIVVKKNDILRNMFNGLVILRTTRYEFPIYYIAAKNAEERVKNIMLVYHDKNELVMDAGAKDQEYVFEDGGFNHKHEKEYEILKLLEQKEELEKESVGTGNQWQEIQARIQEINNKLTEHNVLYGDDDIPTIDY